MFLYNFFEIIVCVPTIPPIRLGAVLRRAPPFRNEHSRALRIFRRGEAGIFLASGYFCRNRLSLVAVPREIRLSAYRSSEYHTVFFYVGHIDCRIAFGEDDPRDGGVDRPGVYPGSAGGIRESGSRPLPRELHYEENE